LNLSENYESYNVSKEVSESKVLGKDCMNIERVDNQTKLTFLLHLLTVTKRLWYRRNNIFVRAPVGTPVHHWPKNATSASLTVEKKKQSKRKVRAMSYAIKLTKFEL